MPNDAALDSEPSSAPQEERQWRKIKRLLHFAYERVPFYRKRFNEMGAEPADFKSSADLLRFPLLTRSEVLAHVEEMLAEPKEKLIRGHSGGSTGIPLIIYRRKNDSRYRHALWRQVDGWVGANFLWPSMEIGTSSVTCNVPKDIGPWRRIVQPHYRYAFSRITEADVERVIKELAVIKPRRIHGFPSYLRPLALALSEKGSSPFPPPHMLTGVGEMLADEGRTLLQEAFGAPFYNRYASRENTMMAAECRLRCGYHVLTNHVYLEILVDGRLTPSGQPGSVVVTDLDSMGMVYIRYQNEDIASWAGHPCPCGRKEPLLMGILGRFTDALIDCDGSIHLGSAMVRPLREAVNERHIQLLQLLQNTEGKLEVLVVPGPDWEIEDPSLVETVLAREFRGRMAISIRTVPRIAPDPSGKTRLVKSLHARTDNNWNKPFEPGL